MHQTEIILSTTESDYVSLSQSRMDVIPLLGLIKELKKVIPSDDSTPKVHCTFFEDNKGCIDLVKAPRMRPMTHIALEYHHFRSYVKDKLVSVHHIETTEQIADIFTKALHGSQFYKVHILFNSW